MIESLSAIFSGELAPLGDRLQLEADKQREMLAGHRLLEPSVLDALLARFARQYSQPVALDEIDVAVGPEGRTPESPPEAKPAARHPPAAPPPS